MHMHVQPSLPPKKVHQATLDAFIRPQRARKKVSYSEIASYDEDDDSAGGRKPSAKKPKKQIGTTHRKKKDDDESGL